MKKRVLAVVLVVSMFGMMLNGCGKNEKAPVTDKAAQSEDGTAEEDAGGEGEFLYTVGVSDMSDADENCYNCCETFKNMVESDEFAKSVGHKVKVEWTDSDNDLSKQTANIETMLSKGVDAIFFLGFDAAGNSAAVKACNDAGVPIFAVATEAEEGEYKFVGFNEYDCGKVQGDYLAEQAEKGDKICYIQGTPGYESTLLREEGFMDGIAKRDDLEILSVQSGNYKAEDAMQVTEDWVQAYGDEIDWIVTQDNSMGQGVVEVLKAANMLDKVRISSWIVPGTWDAEYIKSGDIEQCVFVSFGTLGETMAQVCEQFYKGEEIEERTYMDLYSITKDNYSEFFE
ncbi:sugar ABC transporter substrate-binding protein [Ruminococcus gauvreauii]|uniref:sugar ABC transporter substrate-binding protein n=1 Tax=Ruminococcus gauvreauii TaxID=438033 RepID=UPI0039844936